MACVSAGNEEQAERGEEAAARNGARDRGAEGAAQCLWPRGGAVRLPEGNSAGASRGASVSSLGPRRQAGGKHPLADAQTGLRSFLSCEEVSAGMQGALLAVDHRDA